MVPGKQACRREERRVLLGWLHEEPSHCRADDISNGFRPCRYKKRDKRCGHHSASAVAVIGPQQSDGIIRFSTATPAPVLKLFRSSTTPQQRWVYLSRREGETMYSTLALNCSVPFKQQRLPGKIAIPITAYSGPRSSTAMTLAMGTTQTVSPYRNLPL